MQATVIFTFNENKIIIECSTKDKFINICEKFTSKIKEDISKLNFIYNENIINKELKYEELINEKDNNNMNIIVEEIKKENNIKDENMNNEKEINNNYIIGEIYIKEDDINKDIRIINSFEEHQRKRSLKNKKDVCEYENEKEIKEKIIIKINNNIIGFNYFYKFKKSSKYIIKYIFKENIKKADYMFFKCNSLTKIDFSKF